MLIWKLTFSCLVDQDRGGREDRLPSRLQCHGDFARSRASSRLWYLLQGLIYCLHVLTKYSQVFKVKLVKFVTCSNYLFSGVQGLERSWCWDLLRSSSQSNAYLRASRGKSLSYHNLVLVIFLSLLDLILTSFTSSFLLRQPNLPLNMVVWLALWS